MEKQINNNIDPILWHRIIMCFVVACTGLIMIFGIIISYIRHQQVQEFSQIEVISAHSNRCLPAGDYFIYRIFLDLNMHYLVSDINGGVVVSVRPPDGTSQPKGILAASKYDSASYFIRVDDNGKWSFITTTVLKSILQKNGSIPINEQPIKTSIDSDNDERG